MAGVVIFLCSTRLSPIRILIYICIAVNYMTVKYKYIGSENTRKALKTPQHTPRQDVHSKKRTGSQDINDRFAGSKWHFHRHKQK
jgi:hypothetical protein